MTKAVSKLQHYLDNNAEAEEEIVCPSTDIKEYLLRYVKPELEGCGIKVQDMDDNLIYISGRDEELQKAIDLVEKRLKDILVPELQFVQPGLRKFCESGDLDTKIKQVEEQQKCFIRVEKNLSSFQPNSGTTLPVRTTLGFHSSGVSSSGSNAVITAHGHKISWKPGDITKEQVRRCFALVLFFSYVITQALTVYGNK